MVNADRRDVHGKVSHGWAAADHYWRRCGCSTCRDGEGDAVSRLLADLGADVLKVEPPGGSPARTALPTLAGTSVAFALHNANKRSAVLDPADDGDRAAAARAGRRRRHRHRLRTSRPGVGLRHLVRGAGRPLRAPGRAVGHRLRDDGPALVVAGDRRGALRAVLGAVALRTAAGTPGAAAGRDRVGHRRGAGRMGGAGRLLQPVTLRPWRLHRLLAVRGGGAGAGSAVRIAWPGRRGRRVAEKWRGRPRNQDAYPIIPCQDGHVRLVVMAPRQWRGLRAWLGEPAAVPGPQVRLDRRAVRGLGRDRRTDRRAVRRAHHGRTRGRRAGARGADRRGARAVAR